MDTAVVIRTILIVDIISMAFLGIFYLSQRRLRWQAFCAWSLLAALVPVLGPFLVIASRPGTWNPDFSFRSYFRRAASLFSMQQVRQLSQQVTRRFSFVSGSKKLSRIERARQRRMLRRSVRK